MPRRLALALLCSALTLAACQTVPSSWWGGEPAAPAPGKNIARPAPGPGLGVLLDGWAGNDIVTAMDEGDRARNRQAEKRAYTAPIGQEITWNNPQSGHAGTITPTRDGYAANGVYCREFRQTVTIGGEQQQGYGKACQQADGDWKIVQ